MRQRVSLLQTERCTVMLRPSNRFRHLCPARQCAPALMRSSSGQASSRTACRSVPDEGGLLFLDNGECLAFPKKRSQIGPCFDLSWEDALRVQLESLRENNKPYADHGVEVLYRFANFDPFQRAKYFGRSLDLGQFERFRRVIHAPAYATLLDHSESTVLSTLQVDEGTVVVRLQVDDTHRLERSTYSVTMVQRLGGIYDGYWYTDRWIAEDVDPKNVYRYAN